MHRRLLAALSLLRTAAAVAKPAAPTAVAGRMPIFPSELQIAPAPTDGPLASVPIGELLLKRDDSKTCAYLFGDTKYPLTCDTGNTCSTHSVGSVWHCCSSGATNCYFPTGCLDYSAFVAGACKTQNSLTTCCSESATPYCTSIVLEDKRSVSLVGCFDTRTQFSVYASPTGKSTTPPPVAPTTPSTTSSRTSSSTTSTSPGPGPTNTDSGSQTPTGAIVGGVVGGLAVVALAGGAIAWLLLRRRRAAPIPPAQGAPPPSAPSMAGYPAGSHASYMAPVTPMDPRHGVGLKSPHESMYSSTIGSPIPGSDPSSPGFVASYMHQPQLPPQGQGQVHPYYQPGQYTAELPAERQN